MANPVDTSSFTPQQLAAFNSANALGTGVQTYSSTPMAQTPVNPTPQMQTPPPPTVNVNVAGSGVSPAVTNGSPQQTGANAQNMASSGQLTMPANGSVVDLLTASGQDSSFAARQTLAKQYGIQNYQGTASQNTDLAQKYLDAYNKTKGTQVPQNSADARNALTPMLQDQTGQQATPEQQFMDNFAGMNPIQASLFQQLSGLLSTQNTQTSLVDLFKQESVAQGIPELNMELADINKIMDGSEDDIRSEIQNVGGFSTESQVQALTAARNKTLLKQASYLSNVINAKNDYVNQIVNLTGQDRKAISDDLDRKIGITKTLFDMSTSMQNAAKENYQNIIKEVGYEGLAQSLKGNPTQMAAVEKTLGLAPGELKALGDYKKPLTEMETLELENKKLQNQKLRKEIAATDKDKLTPGQKLLSLSFQEQSITDTDNLLTDSGIAGAVGPSGNIFSRIDPVGAFSGATNNYIASVEQLRQQLTLDKLSQAKATGATFGALSDGERQTLAASATKLGSWAIKDKADNVIGYNASEADFKKELDKINYFQKLDYILKDGDPASVGAQQMGDGTLWIRNSDGTLRQLK